MTRAIVVGSASFRDWARVYGELDKVNKVYRLLMLVECGGRKLYKNKLAGVEYFASQWCRDKAVPHAQAEKRFGDQVRDFDEAIFHYRPDLVIAFPGGDITNKRLEVARAQGLKIWEVVT